MDEGGEGDRHREVGDAEGVLESERVEAEEGGQAELADGGQQPLGVGCGWGGGVGGKEKTMASIWRQCSTTTNADCVYRCNVGGSLKKIKARVL